MITPVRIARWTADLVLVFGNRVNTRSEERLTLRFEGEVSSPSPITENGCGVSDKSAQGPARVALRHIQEGDVLPPTSKKIVLRLCTLVHGRRSTQRPK